MNSSTKIFALRVPSAWLAALRAKAAREGVSIAALVLRPHGIEMRPYGINRHHNGQRPRPKTTGERQSLRESRK